MLLSREWLTEFTDVRSVGDHDFCEAMTLSGSKVETVSRPGDEIVNVVVGRVLEMHRHPDSDHLWVCQTDVGSGTLQIVTGAQNVSVGDLVPVAKHRSQLPGGKKIERGKLRGVESDGMMCSLGELGLDTRDFPDAIEDGIWIISEPCAPGDDIRAVMGADDTVIDFEITPNRPDCLSIIGLAREAAATFGAELHLHEPAVKGAGGSAADLVSIAIADPKLCARYTARMVKNVKIGPSPRWMRRRLRAEGVRPISNIVDITNYVMLEYGQPMHAFDFACVEGGHIVVRTARPGETITTLDGAPRALTPSMLCICDEKKPVCVAGVMGGANSEIVGDTAMVLFESANFDGTSVRRTAQALGMRTDASGRFEKGLDVMNTRAAVDRACELVELLGCGEVVDGVVDVFPDPPAQRKIPLEPARVNALLGTDVAEPEMRRILLKLGFGLDGETILVPSWRGDVEGCADIAEEVARYHGYNNIPCTLHAGGLSGGGLTEVQKTERFVGTVCRMNGYSEIITYSFVSPSACDKIRLPADSPLRRMMKILNPLGEDTSVMRTSALPSMLEALASNRAARSESVKLYELAKVYFPGEGGLAREPKVLSMGAYGPDMDFFRLKGAAESVLEALRIRGAVFTAETNDPSFHPGRCAVVTAAGKRLGVLGQIHPQVAANYGADCELYAVQLDFEAMLSVRGPEPTYTPLPRYPAVARDLAVVCDSKVTAAQLEGAIRASGGALLKGVRLFDVYTGPGVPEGKRSTAWSLTLRSDDGTLTDDHADAAVKDILKALADRFGASLR